MIKITTDGDHCMRIFYDKRFKKILSIVAFFCIILALIIIVVTPPASGYEISIYDAFPWYFWVLLILSIAIGQIIIFFNVFNDDIKGNKVWIIGIMLILIAVSIMVSMPFIRGYLTYGTGDHLTHVGATKDILYSGSIQQNDFYPSIRILAAVIGLISNIDIISVSTFLPRIFPFLFFLGFFIFSRKFFEKREGFLISIIFSSSILFFSSSGNYLAQDPQSFLLLPLLLFVYFMRSKIENTISFNILFLILSISLVFYHPIVFLLFIIILTISANSTFISSKIKKHNEIEFNIDPDKKKVLNPIIILTIFYIAWYFSFSAIIRNFQKIYLSILYGIGESTASSHLSMVSTYNVNFFDILRIIFFQYGIWIITGILSLFSIFYLFYYQFWKKDNQISQYKLLFLSLCIFIFGGLTILSFFFDFIAGWGRFYRYVIFFSLLLTPIAFTKLLKYNRKSLNKKISYHKISIMLIIIFLMLFLSVFTAYRSPIRNEISLAVSRGECVGFIWFFENRNITYLTDELGASQLRFYDALHQNTSISKNLRYIINIAPPDHFGYNNSTTLGSQYDQPNYFIISTLGRIFYPSLHPNYEDDWRFTELDFQMLLDDSTVSTVYSNSGFDVFLINS
jgi:hypothetical protein